MQGRPDTVRLGTHSSTRLSSEENGHNFLNARVLDATDATDNAILEQLRADPVIEFIDQTEEQLEELRRLRPPPDQELVAEPCRWAYYPWRGAVVAVLGPRAFRAVRLDRNRNVITAEEQNRLGTLRIGVAGLSVGHVIAHTLAAQGLAVSFGWRISMALSCLISTGCRRPYSTSG